MTQQELKTEEVAFRAYENFRRLIPQFESFARNVLGRTVPIKAGQNSSTDGQSITIKPPFELGYNYEHNRNLCDKIDYAGFQRCPACGVRENLIFQVYHEISHLLYGTFDGMYDQAAPILREHGIPNVRRLSKATREWSIYHTAFETSPYLGVILNSIEDVRVDSKMFFVKPGLRRMMQVNIQSIMDAGIKDLDGKVTFWKDLPLDIQAIMFFYMTGRKQGFRQDVFAPEVIALESDQKLLDLLSGMERLASVAESFDRAVRLWQHGKSLGFFLEQGTDEPPPEQEKQQDTQEDRSEDQGDETPEESPSGKEGGGDSEDASGTDSEASEPETSPDLDDDGDSDSGGSSESGDSETGESGDDDSGGDQESDEDGDSDAEQDGGSESGSGTGSGSEDSGDDSESESEELSSGSGDDSSGDDEGGAGEGEDDGESSGSGTADHDSTPSGDGRDSEPSLEDDDAEGDTVGDTDEQGDGDADGEGSDQSGDGTGGLHASDNSVLDGTGGEGVPTDGDGAAQPAQDRPAAPMGDTEPESRRQDSAEETEQGEMQRAATPQELWEAYRERHGSTDEVKNAIEQLLGHSEVSHATPDYEQNDDQRAMAVAARQSEDFDEASHGLVGVVKLRTDTSSWEGVFRDYEGWEEARAHKAVERYELSGADLSQPAAKMRKVFSANKRNRYTKNTKRGKVNSSSLGKRAPVNDSRVFQRKQVNEDRDYAVVLVGDISGSTAVADRLEQVKASMQAQADLMWRIGVKFQVLAHSGYDVAGLHQARHAFYGHKAPTQLADTDEWGTSGEVLVMVTVKDWNEPWGEVQRDRLKNLPSTGYNLDGHAFEYCRKQLQGRPETDRLLMYYSDGQMPAKNFGEELHVLEREMQLMEKLHIALAAVGIQDNGPARYGIPMVQYNEKSDIHKVVDHIATQLGAV